MSNDIDTSAGSLSLLRPLCDQHPATGKGDVRAGRSICSRKYFWTTCLSYNFDMFWAKSQKLVCLQEVFWFALIQVPSHPYNGDMADAYWEEFAPLLFKLMTSLHPVLEIL